MPNDRHQTTLSAAEADHLLGHALDNASAAISYAERLHGAIREFLAAEDEVEREARRAEQPGANAWSSAPTVRRIHAVKALREVADE